MKSCFLAIATALLLASTTSGASAATVTVHHKHHKDAEVAREHHHHKHHHDRHLFKETPWEREPETKKAKCADFCLLQSFWAHQLGRNCISRPTGLCLNYKLASAGLEAVIAVAECECAPAPTATNATATN